MIATESAKEQLDAILDFVCINLQLTATQFADAKGKYEAVGEWLSQDGSPVQRFRPAIYPQGSLRIDTTVKPRGREEFDLDLVCEMIIGSEADPMAVYELLWQRMQSNERYRTILERKKRCIRLNYAGDFHMDILPAIPDLVSGGTCLLVPDREAESWKPSNPKGYGSWFETRAELYHLAMAREGVEPLEKPESSQRKPPLKRIVQLFKRWRDIRFEKNLEQAPVSIVLTTIAGTFYRGEDACAGGLAAILDQIEAQVRQRSPLRVYNPSNGKEILSEKWENDPDSYRAFAEAVVGLRQQWYALLNSRGLHQITAALATLFGEHVAKRAIKEHAETIERARSSQQLGFSRGSAMLSTTAAPGSLKIKQNTFHGE